MNPPEDAPRVFISYRHDSPEHVDRVLDLSNRLRADGVDCHLDQYEPSPTEGWLRWMLNQINAAEFVLVVCTEKYRLRFEGKEQPGFGLGANREGSIIDQRIYEAGGRNDKFLPVVLSASDRVHIPETLRALTYYQLGDERGYEQLYRRLTNQPEVVAPDLGLGRAMPPKERKQDFSTAPPLWKMAHTRDVPLDYLKRNQGPEIRRFMDIWQRELLGLIQEAGESINPVRSGLATGRCVIYPCKDAALALIYTRPDNRTSTEMRSPAGMTVADFTRRNQAMRFYDQYNHWEPGYPSMTVLNDLRLEFRRVGGGITIENNPGYPGKSFHQRFDNVLAVGWRADLSDPYLTALEHFQRETAAENIHGPSTSDENTQQLLLSVLSQFKVLLDTTENEGEVQDFLKDNPVLLYPAYSRVEPKFKLGKEYVTDFVFVVQTDRGKEWALVEIEQPKKRLFTHGGQCSHEFIQAQNQLLDWELWIERNQGYLQQDFPGIRMPLYHLVIGRNTELTSDQREKLRTLAKPNHVYSTYDDLVERFETLINSLFSSRNK